GPFAKQRANAFDGSYETIRRTETGRAGLLFERADAARTGAGKNRRSGEAKGRIRRQNVLTGTGCDCEAAARTGYAGRFGVAAAGQSLHVSNHTQDDRRQSKSLDLGFRASGA